VGVGECKGKGVQHYDGEGKVKMNMIMRVRLMA